MDIPKLGIGKTLGGFPVQAAPQKSKTEALPKREATTPKSAPGVADNKKLEHLTERLDSLEKNLGNFTALMVKAVKDVTEEHAKQQTELSELSRRINSEFSNLQNQLGTTTTVANAMFTTQQSQLQGIAETVRDLGAKQNQGTETLAEFVQLFQQMELVNKLGSEGLDKLLLGDDE